MLAPFKNGILQAFKLALFIVFVALVVLRGPHGSTIYVNPDLVIAVLHAPNSGACPTLVLTENNPLYICEPLRDVVQKLGGAKPGA